MISFGSSLFVHMVLIFQNKATSSTAPPKWQFDGKLSNGTDQGFMLNTDFELVLLSNEF